MGPFGTDPSDHPSFYDPHHGEPPDCRDCDGRGEIPCRECGCQRPPDVDALRYGGTRVMLPADAPAVDIIAAINARRQADGDLTDEVLARMAGLPVSRPRRILGPMKRKSGSAFPAYRIIDHDALMALARAAGVIARGS